MKASTKYPLFIISILLLLYSFKSDPEDSISGSYGVAEDDPSAILLTLNKDHSFSYRDYSHPEKKIETNGRWEYKRGKVILKDYESEYTFHDKWKIKEGRIARSRKLLSFYTLHRIN